MNKLDHAEMDEKDSGLVEVSSMLLNHPFKPPLTVRVIKKLSSGSFLFIPLCEFYDPDYCDYKKSFVRFKTLNSVKNVCGWCDKWS